MPAEVKRAATGAYFLFLNENVTGEEIADAVGRYQRDAANQNFERYIVIVEPIQLHNPLRVARLLVQHTPPAVSHYLVVNSARDGAVLAERLAQKLDSVVIEVHPCQPDAQARARALLSITAEDDAPTCDYL